MKKKENYLERIPMRSRALKWSESAEGHVVIDVENRGIFNYIAQKLLKKPRITHVHLDEIGSFLWSRLDGKSDIITLGMAVESRFGKRAEPLYSGLAKYFGLLESCRFIEWQ